MPTQTLTVDDVDAELAAWTDKAHRAEHAISLPAATIAWRQLDSWLDARLRIPTQRGDR